jgi:hypothetical protein
MKIFAANEFSVENVILLAMMLWSSRSWTKIGFHTDCVTCLLLSLDIRIRHFGVASQSVELSGEKKAPATCRSRTNCGTLAQPTRLFEQPRWQDPQVQAASEMNR